jgi:type I restriction enzyme S subunit
MWAIEGGVAVSEYAGAVSPAYRVYELSTDLHPRFIHHWFRSTVALDQYRLLVRGITTFDRSVTREDFEGMPVPVPALTVQRAIADFLDCETSRIDALIAAKRRMMELLDQRFGALIESAILATPLAKTRGLRRFLAMKITDGPHETPAFIDTGVPFVSIEAIVADRIDFSRCRYISEDAHRQYSKKCRPQLGDVLLAKTGATIGKTAVVNTDLVFDIWSPLALLRPRPAVIRPDYLWFCLRSKSVQEQIRLAATQSTQPNIAMEDIAALRVSVPEIDRQDEILVELNSKDSLLQYMQSRIRETIQLLQERRQALIIKTVTGELRVPGVAA